MSASDRTAIQIYNGYLSVATYNGTAYTKKSVAFSSLNKWNHIVMINSGGVVSGYLNGVSMTGSVGPNTSTPNKTYIGTDSYGFFNGSLDDVRIYSRALSANEITQLYKIGAGDKVAASPKVGPTACTTGLSCGLVGYWTFDGKDTPWTSAYAGTTLDKSGKNNTGTLTNMGRATSTTVGKIGQALKFNGKNSHVDIGDPADGSLDFGTNSFSYGLWVYATGNYGEYDMPWYKNGASAGGTGYDMELGSYGWQADVSDGTNIVSATFLASGIYNKWTHLFVVVNRSTGRLLTYVNGSIANGAGNDISTMGSFSTGIGARIGAGYLMRNPFLGKIDDVRVYNRALSAAEVRQLYNLGK